MGMYRKKPVVVEAFQLPMVSIEPSCELITFINNNNIESYHNGVSIPTLEGVMHGNPGDWIIKGVNGEVYPCKPDIFDKTYEKVEDK